DLLRRPRREEILARRLPEALAALFARDADPLLAERRALRWVGIRPGAGEHEPCEPLRREPRDRRSGVAAHRRADRDEGTRQLLEHAERPLVEALAERVELGRDPVELGELPLPHPL